MSIFLTASSKKDEKELHTVLVQELQFRTFSIRELAKIVEELIREDEGKEKKQ